MKILHVISSGGMYGAEAVILHLSRELRASGHSSELAVFTSATQQNKELEVAAAAANVPCHRIRSRGQLDASIPGQLRQLAADTGADIFHAHGYKADVYTWLALRGARFRKSKATLVSTCHTWYDNSLALRVYGWLDRRVLREFAAVVAVSTEVAARLRKAGVQPFRVHTVRNGVNLPPTATAVREKPDLVGLVGRLEREKGVDIFLRAAALVRVARPETLFLIAGDGPDRAKLEGLWRELQLTEALEFTGRIEEMDKFYGLLDVLVSASRQEGLPVALLEGMAHGLPLVATRVGEVPELVLHEATGLLVASEDPAALAGGMLQLLESRELRERLGNAARERIRSSYSAASMAAAYLQVYRDALRITHKEVE